MTTDDPAPPAVKNEVTDTSGSNENVSNDDKKADNDNVSFVNPENGNDDGHRYQNDKNTSNFHGDTGTFEQTSTNVGKSDDDDDVLLPPCKPTSSPDTVDASLTCDSKEYIEVLMATDNKDEDTSNGEVEKSNGEVEKSNGEVEKSNGEAITITADATTITTSDSVAPAQHHPPAHDLQPQKRPSAALQLWALLVKNFWTKFRTPTATLFELFSPLLMMLVLVAAYNLSEIRYRQAQIYSTIDVKLPGPWLNLVQNFIQVGNIDIIQQEQQDERRKERRKLWRDTDNMHDRGIEMDDFPYVNDEGMASDWVAATRTDIAQDIWSNFFRELGDKALRLRLNSNATIDSTSDNSIGTRRLIHRGDDEDGDDEIYALLDDAQEQISDILSGPIPIPNFGQYVEASWLLGDAIGVENLPRVFSDSEFGQEWGNILTLGTIHLTPSNEPTTSLFWSYLNETYPDLQDRLIIRVHKDEQEALRFIDQNLNERTWALLDFSTREKQQRANNENIFGNEVTFKLRMNSTTVPNTNEITNYVSIGLNTVYQMYYLSGFLTLQRTVNEFLLSQDENCVEELGNAGSVWTMPMPTAAYSQNPFFLQVGYLLGLTMVMAFLYPTSRLIKTIVEEKESKMKETLFILGLRGWVHWLSWFLTSAVVFLIITATCSAALSSNVLFFSDPFYIFMYIGLFASSTVGFCFTLAAIFSKAKLASIIGPMALFASILPRFIFFGFNRYEATTGKMLASLLPSTAFAFGADILADYEYAEVGIQEWNVNEGDYSFSTTLGFLFVDTFLYFFLGWYLEQVIPGDYGTPQPFYFLLSPKYWLGCCITPVSTVSYDSNDNDNDPEQDATTVEHVNRSVLRPGVRIYNLFKQYRPEQPPAVNKLNLTLYESQVTTLLGPNGAGKSTTVSILTGLLRPTSGDCILYGNSIVHDPAVARRSLGICPQQNILFDGLTVREHLYFFLRIKGINPTKSVVDKNAKEVGLSDFFNTTSIALSGGNKRKLSVAVALCGDPSVLVLDEPTSAMDPHSRRFIWELIRDKREGRVIFLTTHFMDEAETLSDRIAILKEGRLQCCGSPLFLKSQFGLGYTLTLMMEKKCTTIEDAASVTSFVQGKIPGSVLLRLTGKELSYRLPQGSEKLFPDTFDALERERKDLDIGAFGVANSSLEEIFLQLAKHDDETNPDTEEKGGLPDTSRSNDGIAISESVEHLSAVAQVSLLYFKRFTVQKRDKKGTFFSVVVPVIVMALVLMVLMIEPPFVGPPIEMSPNLYRTASNGGYGETDVLLGSGLSGSETKLRNDTIKADFALLEELFGANYDLADLQAMSDEEMTSEKLSEFLLETYNDHDHNVRFGALVINDTIKLSFEMNWESIRQMVLGDRSLPLVINISASELADVFFQLTGIDENYSLNISKVETALSEGVKDILATSSVNLTDIGGELSATLQSAIEQIMLEMDFNQSAIDIELLLEDLSELAVNGTIGDLLGVIQDFFDEFVNELSEGPSFEGFSTMLFNNVSSWIGSAFSYDRDVVVGSYDRVLVGLYSSFGVQPTWNTTPFIESFVENTGIASVVPLFLLDDIFSMVTNQTDDAIMLGDALFGPLSVLLGGSETALDGYATINITNFDFNTAGETSFVLGFSVTTRGGEQWEFFWTSPEGSLGIPVKANTTTIDFPISASASVLHNSSSPHAVAAFHQVMMQHFHDRCSNFTILARSFNEPLPLTTQQSIEVKFILSVLATLFLLIPFCYIPGAFVVFLVKERVSKSKHLQLVSGVNMTSYWVANYLWDMSLFFALTVLTMLLFLAYGSDSAQVFVGTGRSFLASMMLFFGYGASVMPFAYIFVRNFDNPSSAQISIIGIVFITGFVAVNAYFIMSSIETSEDLAESLRPLFRTWPAYNVGEGYINLATFFWETEILGYETDVFDWDVTGRSLFLLYILAPVYFSILLLLEYSQDGGSGGVLGMALRGMKRSYDRFVLRCSMARSSRGSGVDEDEHVETDPGVTEEAEAVAAEKANLLNVSPIVIHDLWKIYPPSTGFLCSMFSIVMKMMCQFRRPGCICVSRGEDNEDASLPKPAVRGISIAVREGETLGLLGKNGCGKSTTLGILTGDISPTNGDVYVAGHDMCAGRGVAAARKRIGFCPQTDPLLDLMTGRETLSMFARLRGIPKDKIDQIVTDLMNKLTLTPHADKVSSAYSGGNKRKLSLGVAALVGDGGALLIDESSSGMDPGARRKMWTLVQELAQRRSVMLTTHSMEEAEALCTRIVVMDHGRFVAMGTVQQLKTKYLDGYTIDINLKVEATGDEIGAAIEALTSDVLPGSKIVEQYGRFLRLNIDRVSDLGLGTVFRRLQDFKDSLDRIENYSVSQCTLEQVFLKLVKDASPSRSDGEEEEAAAGEETSF